MQAGSRPKVSTQPQRKPRGLERGDARHRPARDMPIHMGVMCDKCRRVHFIGISPAIKPVPTHGMYALICPFCLETKEFRKETLRPYRVSEEVFKNGYAKEGNYSSIPVSTNKANESPQGRSKI